MSPSLLQPIPAVSRDPSSIVLFDLEAPWEMRLAEAWRAHPKLLRFGEALRNVTEPVLGTVRGPVFPPTALKAVVSASLVVSSRIDPLLAAQAAGASVILVGGDERDSLVAWRRGIPVYSPPPNADGATIAAAITALLPKRAPVPPQERVEVSCPVAFACIADARYLPQLLGFLENVRQLEGAGARFHLLALDDKTAAFARRELSSLNLVVHRLNEVWAPSELRRVRRRTLRHRAFSSKAALLLSVLRSEARPVFYLDLDVFLYEPPSRLLSSLGAGTTLLFPHWSADPENARRYGIFNAGMVLVAPGAETFLAWWSDACARRYNRGRDRFHDDQGFLDLAPVIFDGVVVHRGRDENVAYWNWQTLRTELALPGEECSEGKRRLGSYHAAGPDPAGLYDIKVTWDQTIAFLSTLPLSTVRRNLGMRILQQQRAHSPAAFRTHFLHRILYHFPQRFLRFRAPLLPERVRRYFGIGRGSRFLDACLEGFRAYRRWLLTVKTRAAAGSRLGAGALTVWRRIVEDPEIPA